MIESSGTSALCRISYVFCDFAQAYKTLFFSNPTLIHIRSPCSCRLFLKLHSNIIKHQHPSSITILSINETKVVFPENQLIPIPTLSPFFFPPQETVFPVLLLKWQTYTFSSPSAIFSGWLFGNSYKSDSPNRGSHCQVYTVGP